MLLFLSILIASVSTYTQAKEQPSVTIPNLGTVHGIYNDDVSLFLGIPYAETPERFAVSTAKKSLGDEFQATRFGDICVQKEQYLLPMSEDCLFLNVGVPRNTNAQSPLPVMVWIHGGGYSDGSSTIYPMSKLVSRSNGTAIVVTLNYRLNVFGYLFTGQTPSNIGMLDQRLALQWVNENIQAFGGDPTKVTIFGESAGGNSVCFHLATKESMPYYRGAIIESGLYDEGAMSEEIATKHYNEILNFTECKDFDCLKNLPVSNYVKLLKTDLANKNWGPVVDGVSLVDTPKNLIWKQGVHVPVVVGSNRDEFALWTATTVSPELNEIGFDLELRGGYLNIKNQTEIAAIKNIYGPDTSVYTYPNDLGKWSKWWWAVTRFVTDTVPGLGPCAVRYFSAFLSSQEDKKGVYAYFFTHPTQKANAHLPGTGPGSVLVPHASEIVYVFAKTDDTNPGEETDLAYQMSTYWLNFALTGSPNQGFPVPVEWPEYSAEDDNVLQFDVHSDGGVRVAEHTRKYACDWQIANPRPPTDNW